MGVRLGLGGGTHSHCSLSDFWPQEWRVGSPVRSPSPGQKLPGSHFA